MPAAVPIAMTAVSAAASASSANQQKKAAKGAANQQTQLAYDQMQQAQAEKDRWYSQLTPEIADYKAQANRQVISPELTDSMYRFFQQNVDEQAGKDYTRMVQGLERRGLRDSGISGKAMSDFAKGQADVKTGYGLNLAKDAALTNYNAQNQAKQYLMSLMMSGYGGGQGAVNQASQIGSQLRSDAIAANLAARNNQSQALASGISGIAGAIGGAYGGGGGMNFSQWAQGGPGGTIYDSPIGPTRPNILEYRNGQPVYQ